jgi:DNA replication ATP-dependent helicase Dna2
MESRAESKEEAQRDCFLCALDPRHHCQEVQLEGQIVAAQERLINGVRVPIIWLDTGTTRVELRLDEQYYRDQIRALHGLGDVLRSYQLKLRVYHLPSAPVQAEYQGRSRLVYQANAYTLAVLEPDTLLNITDLNMAEYCSRQYLLNRLSPSGPSAAMLRGNVVHYCFKELLKEQDRDNTGTRNARDILQQHLDSALELYSLDIALAGISTTTIRQEVASHLDNLAGWYERERNTLWDLPVERSEETDARQVRAETFLLAPEIGLRGRLDLFWQQQGQQRLLELKTGGKGTLPKREHRWQVYGYHALLTVRRDAKMKKALATLLYSGSPEGAQAFGIPATIRELQRVNHTRNVLVLGRVTGIAPAPPGPSRCTRCAMLTQCQNVSELLDWQPPEPEPGSVTQASTKTNNLAEERAFFTNYYRLLQMEGVAGEEQQALLWKTPVAERIERGTAIIGLQATGPATIEKDGWTQRFACQNTSELREGDEILLSDGDPITGEVVSGTLTSISSEYLTVWTRELIAHPILIDRYDNDLVHVRTLQNLLRWLQAEPHLRDLVAGKIRPRFVQRSARPVPGFNTEQNLAVERSLQMQDYVLIQGPPGTGKTSVIAEIVKQLHQDGQRVMLAAFTNQAVDNMLKRLDREGFHEYLRLGSERSVSEDVRSHLLKALVESHTTEDQHTAVREILHTMPVVASTTATWSSDKYSPAPGADPEQKGLLFDVAIIDEAGQLTVPAILGALRFARRFILVGDEKQLPPLVLSREAAEMGLDSSLFGRLKQLDDDYCQQHPLTISSCISLRTQYRMNRYISHFSSTVFYEKQLQAHESVAQRYLVLKNPTSRSHIEREAVVQAIKPGWPLVFLDVHAEEETGITEVKSSTAEAKAVREVVGALLRRGIAPQDIGIIAPYRAQVANIRRHLFSDDLASGWKALANPSPLSVDTVDRFQGGERMVIIISFATSAEPPAESLQRQFLINPHRLNVALTRAQRKLIVVGDLPALQTLPIFSRLITYCRNMKTLLPYHNS